MPDDRRFHSLDLKTAIEGLLSTVVGSELQTAVATFFNHMLIVEISWISFMSYK